jgi:hypothetical protein
MGQRDSVKSGEVLAEEGRGRGGEGSRSHVRPIWVLVWGGNTADLRARRRPAAGATEARAPASLRFGLGNTRMWELQKVLVEVPRGVGWLGKEAGKRAWRRRPMAERRLWARCNARGRRASAPFIGWLTEGWFTHANGVTKSRHGHGVRR